MFWFSHIVCELFHFSCVSPVCYVNAAFPQPLCFFSAVGPDLNTHRERKDWFSQRVVFGTQVSKTVLLAVQHSSIPFWLEPPRRQGKVFAIFIIAIGVWEVDLDTRVQFARGPLSRAKRPKKT